MIHSVHDILRGRIHGLSALNQIIRTQLPEDASESRTDGDRYESDLLMRHLHRSLFLLRILPRIRHRLLQLLLLKDMQRILRPLHIINDMDPRQGTEDQSLRKNHARIIGIDMNLQPLLTAFGSDIRALLLEKGYEAKPLLLGDMLPALQDEFCPVGILLHRNGRLFLRSFLFYAEESVVAALHDLHQSLAAGVHDAGFLQDRKHVRGLIEHNLHIVDHALQEVFQLNIRIRSDQLQRTVIACLRNRQDRSFLRLHNCLIRSLDRLLESPDRILRRDGGFISPDLAAAAEQLGQDDARVSSCAAQRTG